MRKLLLLFIYMGGILSVYPQLSIEDQLNKYRTAYLPEKVFVHTDKDLYATGETIWMAVYLLDGQTHKPGAFSVFSRLELVNNQSDVINSIKVFLPDGKGSGSIDLPEDIPPGDYQLIAYTNYQRNSDNGAIFRKNISVIKGINNGQPIDTISTILLQKTNVSSEEQIKLQFFPEGGYCVDGLPCVMAFIAEDQSGNPVLVEGIITDQNKQPITFFKTNELGMGVFSYTPKANFQGYAWLANSDINFPIPKALNEGHVLSVRDEPDFIQIVLRSNLKRGLKDARIAIHHRGIYFLDQKLSINERSTVLNIPKEELKPGVYIVTIFDHNDLPVAERLFFVPPSKNETHINLELDQNQSKTRSQVQMTIETPTDSSAVDSLNVSKLSMSIIPEVSFSDVAIEDIRTWALLNSDLDIPMPNAANWLFSKDRDLNTNMIHQFLLTRCWRRFTWEALIKSEKQDLPYELERGIMINGQMTDYEKEGRPRPGKVFLAQLDEQLFEETLTDDKGNFILGPYIFFDTTEIILQGRFKLGKKNRLRTDITMDDNPHVKLALNEDGDSPGTLPIPSSHTKMILNDTLVFADGATNQLDEYGKLSRNMLVILQNFDSLLFQMEAVNISAKRTKLLSPIEQQRKERSFLYNNNPSYRFILDSVPGANIGTNVFDLFYRLPGVNIINGQPVLGGPSSFLGGTSMLIIVDGLEVPLDYLNSLSVADIEFIDLLKGADATIYGARGGNGVVLIYTRTRTVLPTYKKPPGILDTHIMGFHIAKEFAVFDADDPQNKDRPDIRTTLHWNPQIETNDSGLAQEKFTTSDQKGQFYIIVQGIRKDGQVLYGSKSFEVR